MAIDFVGVEPGDLTAAASSMNETYNEMTKIISEMEQLIVVDMRADWHGDLNHRQFRDSFKRGLETLRTNQQAAGDMAAFVERAGQLYTEMSGEVDSLLSQGSFANPEA